MKKTISICDLCAAETDEVFRAARLDICPACQKRPISDLATIDRDRKEKAAQEARIAAETRHAQYEAEQAGRRLDALAEYGINASELSEREQGILIQRYGLIRTYGNLKPPTYDDIARNWGITRERVRQIVKETLAKLTPEQAAALEAHREGLTGDSIPLSDLNLTVRTFNCLQRHGVNTLAELAARTDQDLRDIRNLGEKGIEEAKRKLADYGLKLTPGPLGEYDFGSYAS